MSKSITVQPREIYGKTTYYPACDLSRTLCDIAGTKTVTSEMIRILKRDGFSVGAAASAGVAL